MLISISDVGSLVQKSLYRRAVFYEKYQWYGNSEGEWKYCEAQAGAAGFHIREITERVRNNYGKNCDCGR